MTLRFIPVRLQFMSAGLDRTAVPSSIHCDHLIQAIEGAKLDLEVCANRQSESKQYDYSLHAEIYHFQ